MKSTKSAITGLTTNEEAFAENLAKGYDNTVSYAKVFGVGKCTRKTLVEKALKMAKKHNVITYLEGIKSDTRARGVIDRDEMVDWLKEIAIFGKEKQTRNSKFETWQEMKDASAANSAIDKLIKMGGLYAAEKVETEETKTFKISFSELKSTE